MFVNHGQLPHLLPTAAYFDADWHEREQAAVFQDAWHPICRTSDVATSGDRFAGLVCGVPIAVVNRDGKLHALENVCAHRHSQIAPCGQSRGEHLRCQIHGWEYDETGKLRHLPDGRSFAGIKAQDYCLRTFAVEAAGPLVFVNLSRDPMPLRSRFGSFYEEFSQYYADLRPILSVVTEHSVNWKIVCENAVESYHVPLVHSQTYEDYRPEHLHDHRLEPEYSRYGDLLSYQAERKLEAYGFRFYTWLLINNPTYRRFTHVHLYPNLLLYFGDIYADIRIVEPLGPERCRVTGWGFVPLRVKWGIAGRLLQDLSMVLFRAMGRKIAAEDVDHWPPVQSGLKHSRHRGVLSAREERVYGFQTYLSRRLGFLNEDHGSETRRPRAVPQEHAKAEIDLA